MVSRRPYADREETAGAVSPLWSSGVLFSPRIDFFYSWFVGGCEPSVESQNLLAGGINVSWWFSVCWLSGILACSDQKCNRGMRSNKGIRIG
jgi:hypothetical protein